MIASMIERRVEQGFHRACADLNPSGRFVVYPGDESYRIGEGIEAVTLADLARRLAEMPTF